MDTIAARDHEPPARSPLQVRRGNVVEVDDAVSDRPAFAFVRTAGGEGWVPARHLDGGRPVATVLTAYDTQELRVAAGDRLLIVQDDPQSGWSWCRDDGGSEGWVPHRALAGTREGTEEWYLRYIERCNAHRFDLREWVADDVRIADRPTARAGYEEGLASLLDDVPDLRWEVRAVLVDGDRLAARLIDSGTSRDGGRVRFTELAQYRLERGRIVEAWGNLTRAALLDATG